MCIDDFLHDKTAILISCDTTYKELKEFQDALEDYAGSKLGWTRFSDGFAEYCVKIMAHVVAERHVNEIEVDFEGERFGYMPGGTGWFIDRGINVVPLRTCADELYAIENTCKVSIEELESVLE